MLLSTRPRKSLLSYAVAAAAAAAVVIFVYYIIYMLMPSYIIYDQCACVIVWTIEEEVLACIIMCVGTPLHLYTREQCDGFKDEIVDSIHIIIIPYRQSPLVYI